MKLLLTSAGMQVKDEILKILPKPPHQIKLAHIIDAAKPIKNISYMHKDKQKMLAAGFQVEDVSIAGKTESELREILKDKDLIYVQGGQPFYLLKQVKRSGFEKVVKEMLGKGVIYIGVSASTYLACPTIETSFWKRKKRSTFGLTDFSALNLVSFLTFVHYKPEYASLLKPQLKKAKYPVKILTDDQALYVEDGKVTLVGKGEEVRL